VWTDRIEQSAKVGITVNTAIAVGAVSFEPTNISKAETPTTLVAFNHYESTQ
jgi:hypothetical protein